MKNIKCNKCRHLNEKAIELRGVGLCRNCGNELYIINKKIIKFRNNNKRKGKR